MRESPSGFKRRERKSQTREEKPNPVRGFCAMKGLSLSEHSVLPLSFRQFSSFQDQAMQVLMDTTAPHLFLKQN